MNDPADAVVNPANLFANVPRELSEEFVEILVKSPGVTVERIVSRGHASPGEGWYDQPHAEWVVLLGGAAVLEFEDSGRVELRPGDHLTIPAHCHHRVVSTAAGTDSTWIAVHFDAPPAGVDDDASPPA